MYSINMYIAMFCHALPQVLEVQWIAKPLMVPTIMEL